MELKGTVERATKEHVETLDRDKWIVLVGGKSYDCWNGKIEHFVGKELPAGTTVEPAKNEKYNPKLNLPKEDSRPFGTKQYKPAFEALQARTMLASYAKDLVVAHMGFNLDKYKTAEDVGKAVAVIFTSLSAVAIKE